MNHLSLFFLLIIFSFSTSAQKPEAKSVQPANGVARIRCGTMETIQRPPSDASRALESTEHPVAQSSQRSTALSSPVTIPVVVHIVLPNPHIVTDADVQYFIDRLNRDFSGLNPDSTNGASFYHVRGHSLMRFALARRTPSGQLTNGIERRVGQGTMPLSDNQPVKRAATGGLDPWDHTQYYNLWVGNGSASGLLGIAPTIGVGTAATDGVVIDFSVFASNPCYTDATYNLGRTSVHEIGHNFGLYHINGDQTCGNDFQQLIPPGQTFPTSLLANADDTPQQSGLTGGCPSGIQAAGCSASPNPPGKMYQNYMDYTNDACYSMFTAGQVARMHYLLENYRPGYLTTQGHVPPSNALTLDAGIMESVNPGGSDLNGCQTTNYPSVLSCPGAFTPKVRIRNYGLDVLTSITVGYDLNGLPAGEVVLNSLNIPSGGSLVVTLPAITLPLGSHTIRFYTKNPNGTVDPLPSNDAQTTSVTVQQAVSLPQLIDFEASFPPAGWSVINPTNSFTWVRKFPGKGSQYAAFIDNYNNMDKDETDDLRSSTFSAVSQSVMADSVFINFDVAHKNYDNSLSQDTLSVLVSADCGNTFTTIWKKWGAQLATAGTSQLEYLNPLANEWRKERISFGGNQFPSGNFIVSFRNTNRFGNNIFLDNISIVPLYKRDMQVTAIHRPEFISCIPEISPSVTVLNNGTDTITQFRVGYLIDNSILKIRTVNSKLAPGRDTVIALDASLLNTGQHQIKLYTFDPVSASGMGEMYFVNDSVVREFGIPGEVNAPLTDDFTQSTFPPAKWVVANYQADIPWMRYSEGHLTAGSAFVRSFAASQGTTRDLVTPTIRYVPSDSLILRFDLSASSFDFQNPGQPQVDTLEVLAAVGCGAALQTVYKKWGADLKTPHSVNTGFEFFPDPQSWRNERIDLSSFAAQQGIQLTFRLKSNSENNIFVDNIHVEAKNVPADLKKKGYLVLPNPFDRMFNIWHYETPATLREVTVYNTSGQKVWEKAFNGNAEKVINVDLQPQPAGLYILKMGYEDRKRNVSERIIKR